MFAMKYCTIVLAACLEGSMDCGGSGSESFVVTAKTSLAKVMLPREGSKSLVVASTDLQIRILLETVPEGGKQKQEKRGQERATR